jgi:[ribosomal protein S5]-alanine N-acetyltransferase
MDIYGERLLLSRISIHDLDFICRTECDKDLWYFEEHVKSDEKVVRDSYLHKIEKEYASSYHFVVTLLADRNKTPIGLVKIRSYIEYRKSWEIGYAILPEYGGQSYGSEAAKLLLQFAFEKLDAHKVVGMCNSCNTRSSAIMERIGMTKETVFKEELFWRNQWIDQYYYSILEKEFLLK